MIEQDTHPPPASACMSMPIHKRHIPHTKYRTLVYFYFILGQSCANLCLSKFSEDDDHAR